MKAQQVNLQKSSILKQNLQKRTFISLLFYLGYLTIIDEKFGRLKFGIPNKIMKEIYADYFIKLVDQEIDFRVNIDDYEIVQRTDSTRRKNR